MLCLGTVHIIADQIAEMVCVLAAGVDHRTQARRGSGRPTLGRSNPDVSALGLGWTGMSFAYGPAPDKHDMVTLLGSAVDRRVTFFDTAQVYGPCINEA